MLELILAGADVWCEPDGELSYGHGHGPGQGQGGTALGAYAGCEYGYSSGHGAGNGRGDGSGYVPMLFSGDYHPILATKRTPLCWN